MTAVLRPNEYELIDHQLGQFLDAIAGPSPVLAVVEAVQAFRGSYERRESQQALAALRHVLANSGFALFHGFLSALANRVLRPGSTPQADIFLREALRTWRSEELRLGIQVGLARIGISSEPRRRDRPDYGRGRTAGPLGQRLLVAFQRYLRSAVGARGCRPARRTRSL